MNIFFLKRKRSVIRFRQKIQYKKTLLLFFIGAGFFALSVLTYKYQNLLPRVLPDENTLIRPDSKVQDGIVFKKALIRYGVEFESLTYATQSPTLIVKLPRDAYAYLNTNLDPSSQARILANILSRITIENKNKILKYVDLTHEKAIIKF